MTQAIRCRSCAAGMVLVAGATLLACSDVVVGDGEPTPEPSASMSAPSGITGPPTMPTVQPAGYGYACPARRPDENSPCSSSSLLCEYGDNPDPSCNVRLACGAAGSSLGAWTRVPSPTCLEGACPSGIKSVSELHGAACTILDGDASDVNPESEVVCAQPDGICACTVGRDAAHAHERRWVCVRPNALCPIERPRIGQICATARTCNYGGCDWKRGVTMECANGVWRMGATPCP